jgi:PKD repeat protein
MCGPDQTYILAQAPGNMVQWFDVPVGGTPISTTIGLTTPLLSATDTFWVQTTNANGCVSTRSRVIVVVDLQPFAYFIYDPWPTMVGEPTTFINQSQNGSSFEWWVNGVLESTTQGFIYTFLAEGTYDVTLVVNNGQCTDTISNSILVNPTGLSETLAAGSFRSYPNPATNRITLNWTTPQAKPVAVQLVATTGQVVLSFLPSNELSEMDLHLASLAEGLYWCRVSHANGSFSSLPVLIQR